MSNSSKIVVIRKPEKPINTAVHLPSSKSISNRLLIIQALCKYPFQIINLSDSDDTNVLLKSIKLIKDNKSNVIDVGLAGTTFRFLTALLTVTKGEFYLTGEERITQRPISNLVNALKNIGASVEYKNKQGFAPLEIKGGDLKGGEVSISGGVSSQFISALMLIAPVLKNGLKIHILDEIISRPYISMTMKLMQHFGIDVVWEKNRITIHEAEYNTNKLLQNNKGERYIEVEADWTSASYWYSICALSPGSKIKLIGLNQISIQGDSLLPALFGFLGVNTQCNNAEIILNHSGVKEEYFGFDFCDNPDIAQTVAVTAFALKMQCLLNGLSTLIHKETNRVEALIAELSKLNVLIIREENDGLFMKPKSSSFPEKITIKTYNDHRMAMAFAPLSIIAQEIGIENPEVVNKSYPNFWKHLSAAGFKIIF